MLPTVLYPKPPEAPPAPDPPAPSEDVQCLHERLTHVQADDPPECTEVACIATHRLPRGTGTWHWQIALTNARSLDRLQRGFDCGPAEITFIGKPTPIQDDASAPPIWSNAERIASILKLPLLQGLTFEVVEQTRCFVQPPEGV